MANKITFEFVADDGDIKKGFIQVEKQAKKTSAKIRSSFKNAFSGIGKGLSGLMRGLTDLRTVALGFVAALGVKRAIGAILDAAAVQEDAINQLNSSLIATGKFSEEASKDLQDYASSLQDVTRFGDETTLQVMGLIQSLGNLETDALKGATKATMDMASALKIDLQTAALLVGKAAAGEVGSLSRYGLIVKKGATEAETFARALEAINSKFGGAAQRDVLTYSGATDQLKNTWGDLLETLGESITKNDAIIQITKQLTEAIKGFIDYIVQNMPKMKDIMTDLLTTGIEFGIGFTKIFFQVKRAFHAFSAFLKAGVDGIIETFMRVGAIGGFVKDAFTKGFSTAKENLSMQFQSISETAQANMDEIFSGQEAANKLGEFAEPLIAQAEAYSQQIGQKTVETSAMVTGAITEQVKQIPKTTAAVVKEVLAMEKKFDGIVQQGLVNTMSGGIQSIVTSLMAGEDAFGNFTKFLMGVLGDIAIQLGTTIIASSTAIEALKAAVISPLGGAAVAGIAAGIALVALGSVLKSLSGGGGATGTPSSGATVPVTGGEEGQTGTFPSVVDEDSVSQKGPAVTVNIQGNVLDRKESGLELVNVLNQAFRDQGLKLRGSAI